MRTAAAAAAAALVVVPTDCSSGAHHRSFHPYSSSCIASRDQSCRLAAVLHAVLTQHTNHRNSTPYVSQSRLLTKAIGAY